MRGWAVVGVVGIVGCGGGSLPESDAPEEVAVAEPSSTNGVQDGDETDVDCGGPSAPSCASGSQCVTDFDCSSSVCTPGALTCAEASYSDGVQNGMETDVDCGGPGREDHPCDDEAGCGVDLDCASGRCSSENRCRAAGCQDGELNGTETDVDCGGDCEPCDGAQTCAVSGDCISDLCDVGFCTAPTYAWDASVFSGDCSVTCGTGVRSREVVCLRNDGELADPALCDSGTRPDPAESCVATTTCAWRYADAEWSRCTEDCSDGGTARRPVECHDPDSGDALDTSFCVDAGYTLEGSFDGEGEATRSCETTCGFVRVGWSPPACQICIGTSFLQFEDVVCRNSEGFDVEDELCAPIALMSRTQTGEQTGTWTCVNGNVVCQVSPDGCGCDPETFPVGCPSVVPIPLCLDFAFP